MRIRLRYVNGAQNSAFLVRVGLVLAGMILIVAGGHLTLRLPLADVYAVRTVWATEGSWITMYLFPWLGYVLLPFLCAHAWKNRKWVELVLLGFATYMLFTSTGMKGFLFMPVLVVAVLVIAEWRPPGSFVPLALGVFAIAMVLLDNITGSVAWSSLGLRRVLFVPAHLTSVYLEFFSVNPVVHLSESILLRGWLTYPYPVSVPRMIGAFLGQPAMNSNNGLISDGFSNFGVVGALVWAVLIGIVILLLRAATRQREDRPEAWAVVAIWPDILLSGALTTALLTNGLVLGLLVAWALLPVRLTPRARTATPFLTALAGPASGESIVTYDLVDTRSTIGDASSAEGRYGSGEASLHPGARTPGRKETAALVRHGTGLKAGVTAETRFVSRHTREAHASVSIGRGPGDPKSHAQGGTFSSKLGV